MTNLKDSALITFRVTPEEKKALKVAATMQGVSIREFLRECLSLKPIFCEVLSESPRELHVSSE